MNTLEVKNLKTYFYTRRGIIKAVDDVSFSVKPGETLGIVGESGCGKSITCLSLMGLVPQPAGKIVGGEILLEGENLLEKSEKEMSKIRGRRMSMILQDPMTSLNPVFTVGEQVSWPIRLHQKLAKNEILGKVIDILRLVKIPSPEIRVKEYPHQMSGGMSQRIVGAMALSCQPKLLIADEPTTALDVTIQAQFLKLLKSIQVEFGLSLIMVTHDLGIVAKVCDRVVVMYAGKVVETAPIRDIFNHPSHPYTIALLNSLPKVEKKVEMLYTIEGQPPDLGRLTAACSFAPRCPQAMEQCLKIAPDLAEIAPDHSISCWLAESIKDKE